MNKRRKLPEPNPISQCQTQNNDIDDLPCKYIPQVILTHEIFPKLPVKTLLRFKCVSKLWNSLISNPQFTLSHSFSRNCYLLIDFRGNLHIHDGKSDGLRSFVGKVETNFSARHAEPVGSCNGLVCSLHGTSTMHGSDYYFLWNPSTTRSWKICVPSNFRPYSSIRRGNGVFRGFGYASSIDDYKLVEATYYGNESMVIVFDVCVFTLKTGVWRHMKIPHKANVLICRGIDDSTRFVIKPGTALVNKTLHWLGFVFYCGVVVESLMLKFDLVKEEMVSLSTPSVVIPANISKWDTFLSVVEECLCICNLHYNNGLVEMWVLDEYQDWGSWRKLLKVELGMVLVGSKLPNWNLFGGFGKKIMVRPSGGNPHLLVDLSFDPPKMVHLPREMFLSFAISYVESLVSPLPPNSEGDGSTITSTVC